MRSRVSLVVRANAWLSNEVAELLLQLLLVLLVVFIVICEHLDRDRRIGRWTRTDFNKVVIHRGAFHRELDFIRSMGWWSRCTVCYGGRGHGYRSRRPHKQTLLRCNANKRLLGPM